MQAKKAATTARIVERCIRVSPCVWIIAEQVFGRRNAVRFYHCLATWHELLNFNASENQTSCDRSPVGILCCTTLSPPCFGVALTISTRRASVTSSLSAIAATWRRPRVLDRVAHACRVTHPVYRTERSCVARRTRFILFHNTQAPRELAPTEVRAFLAHLAVYRHGPAALRHRFAVFTPPARPHVGRLAPSGWR
jgi:hypothetical protein